MRADVGSPQLILRLRKYREYLQSLIWYSTVHTDHAVQGRVSYSNYAWTPKSTNRDDTDQGLGCGDTM